MDSIENALITLEFSEKEVRASITQTALEWWVNEGKYTYPLVWPVVQGILAVPVTQVKSERTFSLLKLILSDQRSKLGEQLINDMVVLNQNTDVLMDESLNLNCKNSLAKMLYFSFLARGCC